MTLYRGPMIDVDVHHRPSRESELYPYLPKFWQEFVAGNGRTVVPLSAPGNQTSIAPHEGRRLDAWGREGSYPGSDYGTMREQLLDRFNFSRAVLTHDVGDWACHPNQYLVRAVCRAANDSIQSW